MAEEVLGSGISKGVTDQLLLRESLIGENNKSKEHLMFFNSNGAWIRLVSSINTLDEITYKEYSTPSNPPTVGPLTEEEAAIADRPLITQVNSPTPGKEVATLGSNKLAKNNILFGGMYPQNQKPDGGILSTKHIPLQLDEKGFYKDGNVKRTAYHNYESLGYRPVPGIDSVNIQSKNTYGTLREAEIKITVWTLEDLEVMQALYLRPGYTMLLEWGHSLGLSSEEEGRYNLIQEIPTNTLFVEQSLSQKFIEDEIKKSSENTDYNYDAMFGYVSNFSWSFRQDGGYDCTVKLISKGAVIESISAAFDSSKTYPSKLINEPDKDKVKEERKSTWHKFRAVLDESEPQSKDAQDVQYPNGKGTEPATIGSVARFLQSDETNQRIIQEREKERQDLKPGSFEYSFYDETNLNESGKNFRERLNKFIVFTLRTEKVKDRQYADVHYVPLRTILDICNNYVSTTDPTKTPRKGVKAPGTYVEFYTGWQDTFPGRDYQKESKFITSEFHFSIDPSVCVIPGQLGDRGLAFFNDDCTPLTINRNEESLPNVNNMGTIQVSNFDLAVKSEFSSGAGDRYRGQTDDILNILISLDHIIGILDQIIQEDKTVDLNTSNNMTVLIQRLLQDVNKSLGGINNLDIFYDEQEDINYIVDRRRTPTNPKEIPVLTLAGLNSTISNLNISSKISSNIANQVSIAAQAGNGGSKDNIGPLLQWNVGLVDRHFIRKDTNIPSSKETRVERDRLASWLEDYIDMWRAFKVLDRNSKTNYQLAFTKARVSGGARRSTKLSENAFEDVKPLQSYFEEYCQKYVTEFYFQRGEPKPPPGVIPVELSFSTIGIAGLKIGQSFRFKRGILPQRYSDDFGFIITGLDHSVANNKWTTNVKTQFFCLKPPPSGKIAEYKRFLGVDCTPPQNNDNQIQPQPDDNKQRTDNRQLTISSAGLEEIKKFEQFRSKPYDDLHPNRILTRDTVIEGTLTIGYGFTNAVIPSLRWDSTITQQEADRLLREKIVLYEARVRRDVKVPLTQGEFDALVSIVYNAGEIGNRSNGVDTPLKDSLNSEQYSAAANIIPDYRVTSKGKVLQGLKNRRKSEQNLFLS